MFHSSLFSEQPQHEYRKSPRPSRSSRSNSSSSNTRRKALGGGHRHHQDRPPPPVNNRRRNMAFLKYGSSSASDRDSMNRTRERARQIAMKLSMEQVEGTSGANDSPNMMSIQSTSTFADFGAAFPENKNHTARTANNNLFDQDPFADTTQTPAAVPFATEWPSEDQSMFTMPNNSSMQSKYPASHSSDRPQSTHPVSPDVTQEQRRRSTTTPQQNTSSAGAVARRRFRTQMRQSSTRVNQHHHLSRIDDSSFDNISAPSTPTTTSSSVGGGVGGLSRTSTPPHSPYRRYHSADSIGGGSSTASASNNNKDGQKDHLVHYTPRGNNLVIGGTSTSTNRSVSTTPTSSASNNAGGDGSCHSDTTSTHLFDPSGAGGGFTFDAFGLDAEQINRELNEAMQDLAGSSVGDLSFFTDAPVDDFGGTNNSTGPWDVDDDDGLGSSSRSSTPVHSSSHHQDGFVDGFRVTNNSNHKSLQNLPIHVKHSPASTERSSLTSETGSEALESTSSAVVNLFKEKAGFHQASRGRRVVRPQQAAAGERNKSSQYRMSSPTRSRQQQKEKLQLPSMPVLDDTISPRSNPDVEFFDEDEDSANNNEEEEERTESEAGPLSDVAVNSDVPEVQERQRHGGSNVVHPPLAAAAHRKAPTAAASTSGDTYRTESTVASSSTSQEEKKEDSSTVVKSVGNLRSRFETTIASNSPYRPSSQQQPLARNQRQQQIPESPPRSQVARLQAQHGDEMLEPDRLVSPSSTRNHHYQHAGNSRETQSFASRPKSEGGASIRHSQVNAILNKLETSSSSPRSDTGAPSPSFFNVKLRTTGVPTTSSSVTSPPISPDGEPVESAKKLTYRERRELELQQQRDEERVDAQEASSALDVASLIKKRIAANKKNSAPLPPVEVSQSESFTDQRDKLKPVNSRDNEDASSERLSFPNDRHNAVDQSPPMQEVRPRPAIEKSNLVIDESQHAEVTKVQPSAAVARMLMLQQIQTKVPSPPLSPRNSHDGISLHSGDEQRPKAQTPKATMMMLNAFLSGRDSIGTDGRTASVSRTAKENDDVESSKSSENPCGLPALKDDPKYKRFFRMLSVGLPMDAVKHAMMKEGLDPDVMDGDHNKPVGAPLRLDPTYVKYFKMLSIGLPMEAVKHAMARDGLDPAVMDGDHNLPVQSKAKRAEANQKKEEEKDSHRRARLHWKTLRKVTSNSLWAKIDKEGLMENIEIDEKEFRELFQAEKNNSTTPTKTKSSETTKRGATVRVIDPKRANNGGIVLARLKMSHDEMADAVDRINDSILTAEQIEHMIEYLPTKEERKALETYMLEGGQDAAEKFDGLCECEKFMVSMMTVKHAKRKIRALLFILQFESCVQDIQHDAFSVEAACDELISSVRLRQLLGFVLEFGNRLNTAGSGRKQKAGAFTLDSLLKLNQAKAFDKKTTFLNYLVQIVQRNHELLLQFKDDLPTVFKADKIFWDQCVSDLEEVENQLENVRKISLYQARQHMAYRLRKRNKQQQQRDDDEESLSDGEFNFTLEEEVEMLRATPVGLFTLSAIKYISALRGKVEETKQKFANVLEYFGEEDKNMQPHELFNIVVQFSRDFDKAKEQVAAMQKRKLRDERKRRASNKETQGRPPPYSPVPAERKQVNMKASNHQPSMSSLMNDIKNRSPPRAESSFDKSNDSVQDPSLSRTNTAPLNHSRSNRTGHDLAPSKPTRVTKPISASTPRSGARSVSLREKARLRYMRSGSSVSASSDSQPNPKHHSSSPSPVRTSSPQETSASALRHDSADLESTPSNLSLNTESSRASLRYRQRLEQRRLRQEAMRGAAAP